MFPRYKVVAAGLGTAVVTGLGLSFFWKSPALDFPVGETDAPSQSPALSLVSRSSLSRDTSRLQPAGSEEPAEEFRLRFLRLARGRPDEAIDAALRLRGGERSRALAILVRAWRSDPRPEIRDLATIVNSLRFFNLHRSGDMAGIFKLWNHPEFALLSVQLANQLLDGNDRAATLGIAAEAYAQIDRDAAFAFGRSLSGTASLRFAAMFSRGWAAHDPQAAFQWATAISESSLRVPLLATIIETAAQRAPEQAAQWIATLPGAPEREAAILALGRSWAQRDTAAALDWSASLPTEGERARATAAIQSLAPIGVGLKIQRPGGAAYPVATDLVPSGPAAESGQVQAGDQIVAVMGAGGQWSGTEKLPVDQLVRMIRGATGQPVQLRLLPAGAGDPSQARTVTLTRRQILFKQAPGG